MNYISLIEELKKRGSIPGLDAIQGLSLIHIQMCIRDSCSGCAVKGQGREVESAVLYVLQYVSSIPLNRLYSFTLKENIDKEFEWIVKRYFAVQAGHRFKSAEMLECV